MRTPAEAPTSSLHLRRALREEASTISECVNAAYAHWVPHLGRKPWPMLQDYSAVIQAEHVIVAEERREIVGVLVLAETPDGFLIDNVAVFPSRKGQGIGKALLVHAEHEARERG